MQKHSIAVAISLTLFIICSSHSKTRTEAATNQSSPEIFRQPPLGEEWSSSKFQPLCPGQKHLSIDDFDKIDQIKSKQDAMMACSLVEAMLRQADHEETEIRFLLAAGAGTAGSLVVYHGEIKKGLLLFRKIERILGLKTEARSMPEVPVEEKRLAVSMFYRTWGASALAAGDYATASEKINLAISYSSASECSGKCNDGIENLKFLALLQSSQGEHKKAVETRQRIAEQYRIAAASSSRSNESIHQGFIQALIEEGWARLDIGDFAGAKKLIGEAQESAKPGLSPKLIDEINEIKAALDYRIGNGIATPSTIGSKLDQSAYSFAQGDKISALNSFRDSVKEIIEDAEELKHRVYDKEIALNYKDTVLSLHQAIYSMALANNDEYLETAASILSLNTHSLILDVELSRHAGNRTDNAQLASQEDNTEGFIPTLVQPKEISKNLKSNEILIEFRRFREWQVDNGRASRPLASSAYIGISVDSKGTVRSQRIGNAAEIDAMISRTLDNTLQNHADATESIKEAGDLLLAKFNLETEARPTIYISADGEINRFPFSAYAIIRRDLSLRSIVSGRSLLTMEHLSNSRVREQSLVLSSPNYEVGQGPLRPSSTSRSAKRVTWAPLTYARKEGDLVSQILGARHFYGDAADETVIRAARAPDILHVASHGYFRENESTEDTPSSAVVLAGANSTHPSPKNISDGYLTAAEISRLDLNGTELVVLSACSTGRGDIRTGEGVYGLQRALTVAGARSTMLSLWKVDDEATAEFMERFYTRLKEGKSRSDALAATQRDFRDGTAGNGQWKDPYYWAAWQLVGDWRPIKGL